MSNALVVRNRESERVVQSRVLRSIVGSLLRQELRQEHFELGVYLVGHSEMVHLNETYLQHMGATDVITFDYGPREDEGTVSGEIFVCVPQAVAQARRFRTTWQNEVVRYVVHGLLHLTGYSDDKPSSRRRMKREEDRLVRRLARRFDFGCVAGSAK